MTDAEFGQHDNITIEPSSPTQYFASDASLRLPKNKSTGNLSQQPQQDGTQGRVRFSFDAGSAQEMDHIARSTIPDGDLAAPSSGLRRIRRQPPTLSRISTSPMRDSNFIPPPLLHTHTMPNSVASSRSVSLALGPSVPSSPGLEDMNRFPSESLHSFSFAHQSEDILHSRQNILKKSIDFMRDRLGWAANSPGLLNAQAKASGDSEIQGMMDLLRRANVLQIDTKKAQSKGFSLGPLTGPADVDGANIFEKSFGITNQDTSGDEVDEESSSVSKNPHNRGLDGAADIRPPTPVVENGEAFKNLKHEPRRSTLKRTYTDISSMSLQAKLMEALAQPYTEAEKIQAYGPLTTAILPQVSMPSNSNVPGPHTRENKWAPAAQAVFRTESKAPWTIIAANDLACLIFGVTRGEVRRLGILEVVQEERRQWLEDRLKGPTPEGEEEEVRPKLPADKVLANGKKTIIGGKGGITAMLLSKANSRQAPKPKKAATDDGSRGYNKPNASKNHPSSKSRGVLLCGDVIPIQKRNGSTGSASFWVMEKRGGLIWVLEEITENMATLSLDTAGKVTEAQGDIETIWCQERIKPGTSLTELLPKIPLRQTKGQTSVDVAQICRVKHYTAKTATGLSIPSTTTKLSAENSLRVSSFPHIAGVMVISPTTLKIKSSNPVFSAALFGHEHPEGLHVNDLIPDFAELLKVLTEEDDVNLTDGIVIPEHSFRRARGILALREGKDDAASIFLRPSGLPAKHRDGSEIMIDVQMKVVKSGTVVRVEGESAITERDKDATVTDNIHVTELMYALWVTYSRQMHSMGLGIVNPHHPMLSRPITPPNQPSPPMLDNSSSPVPALLTDSGTSADSSQASLLTQQLIDGQDSPVSEEPLEHPPPSVIRPRGAPHIKKTINDFIILEDMGSGAYGQVKLGRHKKAGSRKMILKYVTKKRILVDTWTRDRRLGTVPLEIHVMDYLRRDGLRHPNIVEMVDFFEDDINYYIEMLPHGIPGMDLFDYIELRSNMEENECRNIFTQVADAIHHLHTKALVVHRDIKDENVVLDGESRIKLIDFGSAAYIKNGPFDVFVGTLDYAAPEVLQGRAYRGKEQDVWALGILLYTIVYKENPFYNIDEILDHPLRIPFIPFSEACIDLIRKMLDRDVDERITITEVMEHPWMTTLAG